MTLVDVLAQLETRAALPASRLKDCKTSLRYLAPCPRKSRPG